MLAQSAGVDVETRRKNAAKRRKEKKRAARLAKHARPETAESGLSKVTLPPLPGDAGTTLAVDVGVGVAEQELEEAEGPAT